MCPANLLESFHLNSDRATDWYWEKTSGEVRAFQRPRDDGISIMSAWQAHKMRDQLPLSAFRNQRATR